MFLAPNLVSDKKGRVRAHHAAPIFPKNECFFVVKTSFLDFFGVLVVLLDFLVWNMRLKVSVRCGME